MIDTALILASGLQPLWERLVKMLFHESMKALLCQFC